MNVSASEGVEPLNVHLCIDDTHLRGEGLALFEWEPAHFPLGLYLETGGTSPTGNDNGVKATQA